MSMKRQKVKNKRSDQKRYSYTAEKTDKKNLPKTARRGGIRL